MRTVRRGGRPTPPMAGTADLLRGLLTKEERYRRLWRAQMERTPVSDVQQSAVARVLAEHLWETGEVDEADGHLPRRLKDTVARALAGRHISPRTLRMFVEAFAMSQGHRTLLWDSLERELASQAAPEPRPGPPGDEGRQDGDWEATLLHEQLSITPLGQVARRRVVKVVRALEPLTRVRLPVARGPESVVVRHGATPGPASGAGPVDLHLPERLDTGETALLEYDVVPLNASTVTEVRTCVERAGATSTVILHVRFHPDRLPRQVWWRHWPKESEGLRRPTRLGPQHDVQQVLTGVHGGTVGFSWRW